MQMSGRQWAIAALGCAVAVAAVLGWTHRAPAPVPGATATSTGNGALSAEPVATTTAATVGPFPINRADALASWSFKGGYAGNDALVAQANADIAHLTGLLGKGEYDDYDLYNGIANDYGLVGDGKAAYQYYDRAIAVHPAKGLAYANLAHLMDQLHAYYTAADAYAKAVAVEPGMLEYHIQRLTYLTRAFPTDSAIVRSAFTDAANVFGDNASILAIEAQWLAGEKRYADAITAWERVKLLSPGRDTSAIDAEIARLKAKL